MVVRREVLASGMGPAMVERLTVGVAGVPIGRAAAGRAVGSPTPRRVDGASAGNDAEASTESGDAGALGEDWLTVGIAEREMTVLDGARRIPPDGAGRAGVDAADDAESGVAAAFEWPA